MKAKEYAEELLASDLSTTELQDKALFKVVYALMEEAAKLCEIRHSSSTSCLIAALKEQQDKWRAFARIVNKRAGGDVIRPDGFKELMYKEFPELEGQL